MAPVEGGAGDSGACVLTGSGASSWSFLRRSVLDPVRYRYRVSAVASSGPRAGALLRSAWQTASGPALVIRPDQLDLT